MSDQATADVVLRLADELSRIHARLDEVMARLDQLERDRPARLDPRERAAVADAVLERLHEAFEVAVEIE